MAQKLQSTMAAKEIKIAFFGKLSQRFIKGDYEMLKKHFEVRVLEPPESKVEWLGYIKKVKKSVKESDVVFGWFAGWHTAPAVYYAKRYGKKSIIVVGGYDAANEPEINYGSFARLKEKTPAEYVLKNAHVLLAVSNFTKSEILKRVKPNDVRVVYNVVDVERFKPSGRKEKDLVITVGVVKWNNLKRKGLETFVRAAEYLPDTKFVVIGKVMDDSIDYLRKIASKNVQFTGFVSDSELVRWYQRAKVVCQLSYYEAFGLAPAEGMACGCIPVVTDKKNGMKEFIGDLGFYVPYGDSKATVEAIKKALKKSEEWEKRVRERIIRFFTIEKREKELIEIVREIHNKTGYNSSSRS